MKKLFLFLSICALAQGQNPQTAVFPGAVASNQNLPLAANGAATTLNGNIGSTDTTITVVATGTFNVPAEIFIDAEAILVCSKAATTFTVCSSGRGVDGTTAASHVLGASVNNYVGAIYTNQAFAEVIAIETKLNRQVVNILDTGAVCDGSTDDTTAINAAVTRVVSNWGSGVVRVPSSNSGCVVNSSAIVAPQGIVFNGDNMNNAGLVAGSGFAANQPMGIIGCYQSSCSGNITMRAGFMNMYFKFPSSAALAGSTCIGSNNAEENTVIYNVGCYNFTRYGIDLNGVQNPQTNTGSPTYGIENLSLNHVYMLPFTGAGGYAATGLHCQYCQSRMNWNNITVQGVNGSNQTGYGFLIDSISQVKLRDIHIEQMAQGVVVDNGSIADIDNIQGYGTIGTNLIHFTSASKGGRFQFLQCGSDFPFSSSYLAIKDDLRSPAYSTTCNANQWISEYTTEDNGYGTLQNHFSTIPGDMLSFPTSILKAGALNPGSMMIGNDTSGADLFSGVTGNLNGFFFQPTAANSNAPNSVGLLANGGGSYINSYGYYTNYSAGQICWGSYSDLATWHTIGGGSTYPGCLWADGAGNIGFQIEPSTTLGSTFTPHYRGHTNAATGIFYLDGQTLETVTGSSNSDNAGFLTIGGGGTVQLTLTRTYTNLVVCTANDTAANHSVQITNGRSAITFTGTAGDTINYICLPSQ